MTEDQNNNINKKEYLEHFIQVLEAKLADLKLKTKWNIKYKGINWYKNIIWLLHVNSLFDVHFYSSLNITLNVFGS